MLVVVGGGAAFYFSKHTKAEVVGISLTKKQIELANNFKKIGESENITFAQADFTDTKFPNNYFDYVYAQEAFCHSYPELESFFDEIKRIMKPCGKLFIIDGDLLRKPNNKEEYKLLNDFYYGWKLNGGMLPDEVLQSTNSSGFSESSFENLTENIFQSTKRMYLLGIMSLAPIYILRLFGIISDEVYDNVRTMINQKKLQEIGIMGYGIFRIVK